MQRHHGRFHAKAGDHQDQGRHHRQFGPAGDLGRDFRHGEAARVEVEQAQPQYGQGGAEGVGDHILESRLDGLPGFLPE